VLLLVANRTKRESRQSSEMHRNKEPRQTLNFSPKMSNESSFIICNRTMRN
jgi:hypothetical protein